MTMSKIEYAHTAPNTWRAKSGNHTLVIRRYTAMGERTFEVWNTINAASRGFVANEHIGDAATLADAKRMVRDHLNDAN